MTRFDLVARPADCPQRDMLGEAPFWCEAEAALYWVDIAGKRAHRFDPATGAVRHWRLPSSCSALVPTVRGDAIVALADGLHRLDFETGATRLFARPDPDLGNRSNECRADPQGRIWLGTMDNNLGPEGEPLPLRRALGGFFCVSPDGSSLRMMSNVAISNTLAWSPDGRRFYCADTAKATIWVFDYDPEGPRLSHRRVFVHGGPGGPDGSAMDEEGCLWNARWGGGRVIRFRPDGTIDREIELPVAQPSNVAFGGADRKTLYVTSARQELEGLAPDSLDGSVFAISVDVAGVPMARFAG